jgi:hypothetical protein
MDGVGRSYQPQEQGPEHDHDCATRPGNAEGFDMVQRTPDYALLP